MKDLGFGNKEQGIGEGPISDFRVKDKELWILLVRCKEQVRGFRV
jgi:hypothetical protein